MEGQLFFKYKGTLSRFKAWKLYHVCLTFQKLSCYVTRFSLTPAISINLRDVTRVERNKKKKNRNKFRVWAAKTKTIYSFKAADMAEADKWCSKMVKVWREVISQPREQEIIDHSPENSKSTSSLAEPETPRGEVVNEEKEELLDVQNYQPGSAEYVYAILHNSMSTLQKLIFYFVKMDFSLPTTPDPNLLNLDRSKAAIEHDIILMQLFPDNLTILRLLIGFEKNYVKQFLPYQPYAKKPRKTVLANSIVRFNNVPGKVHIPLRPLVELESNCSPSSEKHASYMKVARASLISPIEHSSSIKFADISTKLPVKHPKSTQTTKSLCINQKSQSDEDTCTTLFTCREPIFSLFSVSSGLAFRFCKKHYDMLKVAQNQLILMEKWWLARDFSKNIRHRLVAVLVSMLDVSKRKKEKGKSSSDTVDQELEEHGLVIKTLWSILIYQKKIDFEKIGLESAPNESNEEKKESYLAFTKNNMINDDDSDEDGYADETEWEEGNNLLEKGVPEEKKTETNKQKKKK